MPKDKLTDYSATNASNTDVGGVNIDEGMLPSAVNNSIRELMTHLKNFSDGTDAITGLTVDGNIKLDGNYPTGSNNVALGNTALDSLTTAPANVAIGANALTALTTGDTIGENTAVGHNSMAANTTGFRNTAYGAYALDANTTSDNNTALGWSALSANTTGGQNTAAGYGSLALNTTASSNTAVGYLALNANTTGPNNTAVGYQALLLNTTGSSNVAVGVGALDANTTSTDSTAVGTNALGSNTGAGNTAIGSHAADANTSGVSNVAIGVNALGANTTASNNTAVGTSALLASTAQQNTAVGSQAFQNVTTGQQNTAIGYYAGQALTTGSSNTFVGVASGDAITTGQKNTILGRYNGNQGGLDIRTSNNHIVLSDGDGNPRLVCDNASRVLVGPTGNNVSGSSAKFQVGYSKTGEFGIHIRPSDNNTGGGQPVLFQNQAGTSIGSISANASNVAYNTSSDYRLKENVADMTGAIARVKQLSPKRFSWIVDGLDAANVDGFLAHEAQAVVPEAVTGSHNQVDSDGNPVIQGMDYSKVVPVLTAALKEAITKIETLEAKVATLEGAN